jgi:hypothetical protein
MSSAHQSGEKTEGKKKEHRFIMLEMDQSVTPAEEHDDASADDVEPSLLLP